MRRLAMGMIALTGCSLLIAAAVAEGWRGPGRTGVYDEKNLLEEWPDSGPTVLWRANVPKAYSSVTVADGRLYTTAMEGSDGYVYCFDAAKGKQLWKQKFGSSWTKRSFSGPRTTPTVAHGLVFVVSTHGRVVALDAEKGTVKWAVDMPKVFGGQQIKWGVSESPLVVDDKLIVTPGGTRASIVALDAKTGTVEWKTPPVRGKGGAQRSAYCSPALIEHNKRKLIVTHLSDSVVAVDAKSGKGLWSYAFRNRHAVHANTPQYHDGMVIVAGGYRHGAAGLKLSADGSKYKRAWTNKDLATQHGGLVLVDGYVYGTNDRELVCVDAKTGKTQWTDRSIPKGSVVYADGKLIFHTERGRVGLAKVSPKGCQVVSTFGRRVRETWSHPVIAKGRLYVRQGDALSCYDIRGEDYDQDKDE